MPACQPSCSLAAVDRQLEVFGLQAGGAHAALLVDHHFDVDDAHVDDVGEGSLTGRVLGACVLGVQSLSAQSLKAEDREHEKGTERR